MYDASEVKSRLWTSYRHALEQDFEHLHPEGEGEPECPACWVQTIANVLGVTDDQANADRAYGLDLADAVRESRESRS